METTNHNPILSSELASQPHHFHRRIQSPHNVGSKTASRAIVLGRECLRASAQKCCVKLNGEERQRPSAIKTCYSTYPAPLLLTQSIHAENGSNPCPALPSSSFTPQLLSSTQYVERIAIDGPYRVIREVVIM